MIEDTSDGTSLALMQARQMMGMSENDEQSTVSVSPEQRKYRTDVLEALETLGNGLGNAEFSKEIALLREEALELPEALKALEIADASSIEPEFWELYVESRLNSSWRYSLLTFYLPASTSPTY